MEEGDGRSEAIEEPGAVREYAEEQGFEVDYTYSGRFMYGATCPSIRTDGPGDFRTESGYRWDRMGRGVVIYCPS